MLTFPPPDAVFQPIRPSFPSPLLVLATGLGAALLLRAMARVVRR